MTPTCSVRGCVRPALGSIYGDDNPTAASQHFWRGDGQVCAEHGEVFWLRLGLAGHVRERATHTTIGGRGVVGRLKP